MKKKNSFSHSCTAKPTHHLPKTDLLVTNPQSNFLSSETVEWGEFPLSWLTSSMPPYLYGPFRNQPHETSAWVKPLVETRHLALINCLNIRKKQSGLWISGVFLFLKKKFFRETEHVCSKRRCGQWTSHPGFLRVLLLSLQPRPCCLSPRRNCMLAKTIGLIDYILQKV